MDRTMRSKCVGRATHFMALVACLMFSSLASAETVTYYVVDHLGSPVAAMQSDGTLLWRESYDPYGGKRDNPSSADNDSGYTGHQFDAATDLTYMQARYYDPVVGRFMGVDPVGFTPSNTTSYGRYSYARNSPYSYIDPDGRDAWGVAFGVAGTGGPKGDKGGVQINLMVDSQGNFAIQVTEEYGMGGGQSVSLFANVVYSTADSVNELNGPSLAISGSAGPAGGSYASGFEISEGDANGTGVTREAGVSLPLSGGSPEGGVTIGATQTIYQNDVLGQIGNHIANGLYDLVHGDEDNNLINSDGGAQ